MSKQMIFVLVVVSSIASYCCIRTYLWFALKNELFDIPNERSSHSIPTPRGGGIAFVLVFSVAVAILGATHILVLLEVVAAMSGVLVAAVGYWDDRCDVRRGTRFAVQIVSACLVVVALGALHLPGEISTSSIVITALMAAEILGLTWLLNLTNFMDGIDGIVSIEVISVTAICAGLIIIRHGITGPSILFALLGIIVIPFIVFNWSPAKIFMGDVGSGYLGFTVGVISLIAVARHQLFLLTPLIIFGAFISDATTTLITRMLKHEPWYEPHRTHAYQICAEHYGHKCVVVAIGIVNLIWLGPLAVAAEYDPRHGLIYALFAIGPLAIASYLVRKREFVSKTLAGPQSQLDTFSTLKSDDRYPKLIKIGVFVKRYSSLWQLISIAIVSLGCVYGSILLSFDGRVPHGIEAIQLEIVVLWSTCQSLVLACFRVHRSHWRFTSIEEVPQLVVISVLASVAGSVAANVLIRMYGLSVPRSIYLVEALISILAYVGLRVFSRLVFGFISRMMLVGMRQKILIYSADTNGVSILSEIRRTFPNYHPIGFIDDRPEMKGLSMCGLRVLGSTSDLKQIVKKHSVHHALINAQNASEGIRIAREKCCEQKIELRVVTSFAENNIELQRHLVKNFAIEELLDRQPVSIDSTLVAVKLTGRVVMVTGAAGSIGSELCRQIAVFRPAVIVGYEISETALFFLERELREQFPEVPFIPCIGSVQNEQRLSEVVATFRPELVYHAAAYKHVPLMEQHIFEAMENNITATQMLLRCCENYGVKTFVMISTDKAVRPTSLMGATKRVAELVVRASSSLTLTCVSTRFGNVLGSNGSVIPIFRSQILAGGPVKITHPSMVRYFMTIPEAAQLVLQASSFGARNEIYVLAMGEPVRIVDLADRMIRLMGYDPGREVAIEFTGIRPGEKLYEELSLAEEETVPTSHPKISVFKDKAIRSSDVLAQVDRLKAACDRRQATNTLRILQAIVPDYTPSKELIAAVAALDSVPIRQNLDALTPVSRL
jgi:FlaA1/EpsC-like NDP-sugar epimerase/UDP-N-acetylmuramyl pentapeptide phosphotransferase/UDP-N-acetylglucosamine-1-phosphate transferase